MTDLVLSETRDGVTVLTLNRPEKLNALNYALIDRLLAALDDIEVDDGVRAVILTGAGERAFSAGGDIHEFSASVALGADVAMRDFVMRGQRLTARLEAFRKPVIAAVNGIAFGGGCEITEAVPLAIASEPALFAKPEINLAMPPTFGGTQRLPRLAGRKRALELLLTGDWFLPQRALELGLVNQVVPHGDLMPAAIDLARRILRHSGLAVASILTAVTRGLNQSIAEGLLVEAEQFAHMAPTADLREGLDAWIERRQPGYDGSWTHIARPDEARRASLALDQAADQGATSTWPFMLGWKRQK
ncbi:crotonase/enoyl-CoA hydratase family protein [Mesorhizobium sp. AR07]|uniref:crotonase/enoyl-CoA hydratase family protein n=1 Tax=Mesorhizobium sp. AR07 TaxID=2865838 RepID=UPI00215F186D|nr:crotonase/enoyl-CoA hydratase family protein [Mesorhizobium sp. AR07]UVK44708.1 crotonase/enoyl-CoA hydratase family protein [Mesorhizobium sp. AR07]